MRRTILYIFLLLITACEGNRGGSDNQALIEAASADVSYQRFDEAMEKALQALDMADDDPFLRVRALSCITDWETPCEDIVISNCVMRSCSKARSCESAPSRASPAST